MEVDESKSDITEETGEVFEAPTAEKMSSSPETNKEETDDASNKAVSEKSVVEVTQSRDLTSPMEDIQAEDEIVPEKTDDVSEESVVEEQITQSREGTSRIEDIQEKDEEE